MLNFNFLMIGTENEKVLVDFYKQIFNTEPEWFDEDMGYYGFQVGASGIMIGRHSEVSGSAKEPARILFGLEADNVDKEFDRIKATGAKVIRTLEQVGPTGTEGKVATFADPEGNYFQLSSPWEE